MRNRMRMVWMLAAALSLPMAAVAQQEFVGIEQRLSPGQVQEIGLTPKQIELIDRYLRESQGKQPLAEAQGEGASERRRGPAQYIGLDDEPIESRVTGTVLGWEPGTVFALENGQQWKVLKGSMRLGTPLQSPAIVVVPGIAGRWFLQVDEDLPKARVYRID